MAQHNNNKHAFSGSTVYAEQFNETTLVDNLLVFFNDVVSTTAAAARGGGGSSSGVTSAQAPPFANTGSLSEDCQLHQHHLNQHLQQQNNHYAGSQQQPRRQHYEQVRWAKFDQLSAADLVAGDQPASYYDEASAPLLLLLGLDQGLQAWLLRPGGDAQLVLRLGHCPARIACLLPSPRGFSSTQDAASDRYRAQRPLLAVCWARPGADNAAVFLSLRTHEPVREPASEAAEPLDQIVASRRRIVLAHTGAEPRVLVLGAHDLAKLAVLSGLSCPAGSRLPLALADRWLAYADRALRPQRRSACLQSADALEAPPMTSVLRSVTAFFSGSSVGSGRGSSGGSGAKSGSDGSAGGSGGKGGGQPGIVTVLDLGRLSSGAIVRDPHESSVTAAAMVAHFAAHASPLAWLAWDPAGGLLLTADTSARYFHVFRLLAHPLSCTAASVQLLYRLYRGETPAGVQDAAFSRDSRWVAVSTNHGTTHVFPICPYGGSANWRTHAGPQVVNRASCYQKTSGFEPQSHSKPVVQSPVAQVKLRPAATSKAASSSSASSSSSSGVGGSAGGGGSSICKAAVFAPARANLQSSDNASGGGGSGAGSSLSSAGALLRDHPPAESLFVFTGPACCSEHSMDVQPKLPLPQGFTADRAPPDQPIELDCRPVALWRLTAPPGCPQGSHPALLRGFVDPADSLPAADARSRESLASDSSRSSYNCEETWPSQIEINCHLGPARRLWMGPQFTFRTYQDPEAAAASANSAPSASAVSSASLTASASAPAPVRRRASSSGSSAASGRLQIEGGSYTEPGPLIQRAALLHSSNPSSSLGSDSLLLLNDAIQDCRSPSPVVAPAAAGARASPAVVDGFRDEDFQESWE